jgi:hypothetical protein
VDVGTTGSASGYVPQPVTTAPIDWKMNPYLQVEGGFLGGLMLGAVPFGGVGQQLLDAADVLPHGTPEARRGLAVGLIVGGIVSVVGGATGEVLGGIASVTGIGAAVGVPAMVVSTGLVVGGVANIAAGIQGLMTTGAGSTSSQGAAPVAGGGAKTTPKPAATQYTPDQKALTELVDEASHGGRSPLPREQAETVLDWAQEYKHPGARATSNDVTGNHPGTQWNGKPHIHIPGAGRGGHIPVERGVKAR